jgi:hypothetical protein
MSQTQSTQRPKISGCRKVNDPTYHGPESKMFTWKRNICLHLGQTRLPKRVYDHVGLGSEIFDLPPSYKAIEAKIVATPDKKREPDREGQYWIESPGSDPIKRLCFTDNGELLENASVGTLAKRRSVQRPPLSP